MEIKSQEKVHFKIKVFPISPKIIKYYLLYNVGKETLSLPTQYLAMDWRNNPKDKDHVEVTVKDDMVVYCL